MSDRIEKLKSFLAASPDDCFLNHALALEYIKAGDETAAKALFEKNMQHDPAYVATYYHLAKLLERTGLADDAIRVYEEGMVQAKKAGDMHSYSELQSAYEDLAY
ncbi:tetratricopeptide repeat protein [Chitinophagaceae bacterium MMS25-I14]